MRWGHQHRSLVAELKSSAGGHIPISGEAGRQLHGVSGGTCLQQHRPFSYYLGQQTPPFYYYFLMILQVGCHLLVTQRYETKTVSFVT